MGVVLAIDTVAGASSVALGSATQLKASVEIREPKPAASLMPVIAQVLERGGCDVGELSCVLVANGPGSFTGIRVGFATAIGMIRQHPGIQLWTAPSLMAVAFRVAQQRGETIAALYDALRGEVFAAVYEFTEKGVTTLLPPKLTSIEELQATGVVPTLVTGDGAAAFAEQIEAWTGRPPVHSADRLSLAESLIKLTGVSGGISVVADPTCFEPTYGRLAEAQVRWEQAQGRPLPSPLGSRKK
ncbi:MAG: tRNA (adenosine(37)-N6)-threonylcarbamoyltransferase complex dimerization subunit type 1 TsaB [Gemmatimonadales bacterium]